MSATSTVPAVVPSVAQSSLPSPDLSARGQTVTLAWNGHELGTWDLDLGWQNRTVFAVVPDEFVQSGFNTLTLRPAVQADGSGDDKRPLGVFVRGLRLAAALSAGESDAFAALGRAMVDNNEAQARLNPALVGSEATAVVGIAREHGTLGWKVNGAGGEGGSITLLCDAHSPRKRELIRAVESANPAFRHIPTYLSRSGLRVWTAGPESGARE